MSHAVFLKVCCIASVDEARAAVAAGASALGLVSAMPSGPGVIDEDAIAAIIAAAPPGVETFLLTSQTRAAPIAEQQRRTRASALQLVDRVPDGELRALREALPGVRLVQVIHVRDGGAVEEALRVEPLVDALLLDSGDPGAAVPTLGGTGRVHDWRVSRRVCESVRAPVFLAGGLRPSNVVEAVETVRPAGLDVCSGLRRDGRLDAGLLADFARRVALRAPPVFG